MQFYIYMIYMDISDYYSRRRHTMCYMFESDNVHNTVVSTEQWLRTWNGAFQKLYSVQYC